MGGDSNTLAAHLQYLDGVQDGVLDGVQDGVLICGVHHGCFWMQSRSPRSQVMPNGVGRSESEVKTFRDAISRTVTQWRPESEASFVDEAACKSLAPKVCQRYHCSNDRIHLSTLCAARGPLSWSRLIQTPLNETRRASCGFRRDAWKVRRSFNEGVSKVSMRA